MKYNCLKRFNNYNLYRLNFFRKNYPWEQENNLFLRENTQLKMHHFDVSSIKKTIQP